MKKGFFGWLIVLFSLSALISSCPANTKAQAKETVSEELVKAFEAAGLPLLKQKASPREFSLPLLRPGVPEYLMKHVSLSEYKGKVVFLNFWATWCGPCREEMPSIEALYTKYKDKGLEILAVNSGEKSAEVLDFMRDYNLSFPAVLDLDATVSRAYGIQAIPTSYLIDREGNIVMRFVGSINWNTLEIHAALEQLLGNR
jgi:thiol-disulfide isomerase/thioredoxin